MDQAVDVRCRYFDIARPVDCRCPSIRASAAAIQPQRRASLAIGKARMSSILLRVSCRVCVPLPIPPMYPPLFYPNPLGSFDSPGALRRICGYDFLSLI
jgi:hypothetical protein